MTDKGKVGDSVGVEWSGGDLIERSRSAADSDGSGICQVTSVQVSDRQSDAGSIRAKQDRWLGGRLRLVAAPVAVRPPFSPQNVPR